MPKKIIIVEDDPDLVSMIQRVLKDSGYDVLTASDGQEALRILKTIPADLIIMDLNMPVMTGWHLSMKVRKDERYKKTPIIVLSGMVESQRKPEEFEPANLYLPKPFDIFELLAKVKGLLKDS